MIFITDELGNTEKNILELVDNLGFKDCKTIETIENLLNRLNKLSGLPTKLSDTGVKKENFDKIARKALNDGAMIVNPKQVTYDDVIEILNKAY